MPSWLGRKVLKVTGPAAGTPAADIQARWLAVVAAGERKDGAAQRVELDRLVDAARAAGFHEIVAAVDRLCFAIATDSEPFETAIKASTRAIYSLPFRPLPGTPESRLLNAWAAFESAPRHSGDLDAAFKDLVEATKVSYAPNVAASILILMKAPTDECCKAALRGIALAVYKDAYHRPPPPPLESY